MGAGVECLGAAADAHAQTYIREGGTGILTLARYVEVEAERHQLTLEALVRWTEGRPSGTPRSRLGPLGSGRGPNTEGASNSRS
jgi:hypothetical protein